MTLSKGMEGKEKQNKKGVKIMLFYYKSIM